MESVMLAKPYKAQPLNDHWYMTVKLDGVRAIWDGGVSRGVMVKDVPYACRSQNQSLTATGLWSRYWKPIYAPGWWLDQLPGNLLDGELWIGNNQFQRTCSIVKASVSERDWTPVNYWAFASPPFRALFQDRDINTKLLRQLVSQKDCYEFFMRRGGHADVYERHNLWEGYCTIGDLAHGVLRQVPLADDLDAIVAAGGEGIIAAHKHGHYECRRSPYMLKLKPVDDADGIVIGCTTGEGKYSDTIGALIVSWNGLTFNMSGMTDQQRRMGDEYWIGKTVTFRYWGLYDSGKPRQAQFLRVRDDL